MPSSHLILCHPLLLLPPIAPSIRVFSNESTLCMRCPKYWSFSFSISPSKEHLGLISFRMDWLDLLAVQEIHIVVIVIFFRCSLRARSVLSAHSYTSTKSHSEGLYPCFQFQLSSVSQSCPALCDPMNRSMPGLPVHHHLPEFTQTHVHRVSDAIQPSHPLSSPSPPAPNCSQHQSLFQ